MKAIKYIAYLIFAFVGIGCNSDQSPEKHNNELYRVNQEFHSVIPIDIRGNKIFLNAKVNGNVYRFILDSGSTDSAY